VQKSWSRRTLLDGDFSLVPTHDIGPFLASVLFADFTSLLAVRLAVTDDGNRGIVMLITNSDPGDTVGYLLAQVHTPIAEPLTVVPVISMLSVAGLSASTSHRQRGTHAKCFLHLTRSSSWLTGCWGFSPPHPYMSP
jgi:hypothetical protein